MCTMASAKDFKKEQVTNTTDEWIDMFWWLVGISMLTFALLLSAGMGIIQEKLYKEYGKYPDEALYYNVILIHQFHISINYNLFD